MEKGQIVSTTWDAIAKIDNARTVLDLIPDNLGESCVEPAVKNALGLIDAYLTDAATALEQMNHKICDGEGKTDIAVARKGVRR